MRIPSAHMVGGDAAFAAYHRHCQSSPCYEAYYCYVYTLLALRVAHIGQSLVQGSQSIKGTLHRIIILVDVQ